VPESALLFDVLVLHGATPLRSLSAFVVVPKDSEEKAIFERVRTCLMVEHNEHDGRAYCASCGAQLATTEPSCRRCGAKQFSIESLAAELENLESRVERRVEKLAALQESVVTTASFKGAIKRLFTKPVELMPAKAPTFRYVLFRNRLWTTKELLSPEEWDALVRDYDERKYARLQGAKERLKESTAPSERRGRRGGKRAVVSGPSYQTAPLTHYHDSFRKQADAVFEEMCALFGQRAKRHRGSYSVLAKASAEAVAKIVIYQRGMGRENGVFPILEDGVYFLTRIGAGSEPRMWEAKTIRSTDRDQPLDAGATIGIAPRHEKRFAYFRIADTPTRGVRVPGGSPLAVESPSSEAKGQISKLKNWGGSPRATWQEGL
jgi:hypothetical protein